MSYQVTEINKETERVISDVERLRAAKLIRYDSEVCRALDWDNSILSMVMKRHRNMPKKKIIEFYNKYSVLLKDLPIGENTPAKTPGEEKVHERADFSPLGTNSGNSSSSDGKNGIKNNANAVRNSTTKNQKPYTDVDINIAEANNELHPVPFYDNVIATAGGVGTFNPMQTSKMIHLGDLFKDAQGSLPIYGHSMYPDYENGCVVGFREITDPKLIAYNEVYVVVTEDFCLVKKINKHIDEKKYVILSSINLEYEPFEVAREQILKIYIVLGKISRAQTNRLYF